MGEAHKNTTTCRAPLESVIKQYWGEEFYCTSEKCLLRQWVNFWLSGDPRSLHIVRDTYKVMNEKVKRKWGVSGESQING